MWHSLQQTVFGIYTGVISLFKQSMNNKELQVLIFDELDHVARHDLDLKQDYLKIGD